MLPTAVSDTINTLTILEAHLAKELGDATESNITPEALALLERTHLLIDEARKELLRRAGVYNAARVLRVE